MPCLSSDEAHRAVVAVERWPVDVAAGVRDVRLVGERAQRTADGCQDCLWETRRASGRGAFQGPRPPVLRVPAAFAAPVRRRRGGGPRQGAPVTQTPA